MNVLEINGLCKKYPAFCLDNVSFSLEKGKITGFIGRNGAGKTTTLKSLLNFVHPDSGEILFFDKPFCENEFEIKQKLGFVAGGIDYYSKKKLRTITAVTKSFYDKWDDAAYYRYMELFKLDDNKTPAQLSAGMKVKYSLVLALSHNAELLILDEPTSGLDPVSRDDLLDVFMELCSQGITIFFSTHITSDLDKCADNIVYIKNGEIIASDSLYSFVNGYQVMEFANENEIDDDLRKKLIGLKKRKVGYSALIRLEEIRDTSDNCVPADLESIMVHLEKGEAE